MSKHRLLPFTLAALVATVLTVVGFVGSGAAAPGATFKAALVSDVGRFNDKGFNQNQLVGLKLAKAKLKIQIGTAESTSDKDYVPNFTTFAAQKYNIVIGAGFLLTDAEKQVADQFPSVKFAITDVDVTAAPYNGRQTPNIMGSQFSVEQNSYLVGCLAALMAKKAGGNTISGVGGIPIPPVKQFFAGYLPGAKKCVKGINVKIDYSGSFTEQDKCKALALNQIAAGSKVVYNVAGPCGFGTLDLWVYRVCKAAKNGTFRGGTDMRFTLKNAGVGVGKISKKVPKAYIAKMNALKKQIISGKIKIPTST